MSVKNGPTTARDSVETDKILGPAYQARIIALDAEELRKIEVEPIYGELVSFMKIVSFSNLILGGDKS